MFVCLFKNENGADFCLTHTRTQSNTFQANSTQLNLKIGAIKANLLRVTSQYNVCNGKLTKALSDLEETTSKCDQLQIEVLHHQSMAKQREAELVRLARENAQMMKNRDAVQKRIQNLESERRDLAKEVTKLRCVLEHFHQQPKYDTFIEFQQMCNYSNSNSIVMLEKQHENNQKALEKIQKSCDELLRERDAIHKELKKTESA